MNNLEFVTSQNSRQNLPHDAPDGIHAQAFCLFYVPARNVTIFQCEFRAGVGALLESATVVRRGDVDTLPMRMMLRKQENIAEQWAVKVRNNDKQFVQKWREYSPGGARLRLPMHLQAMSG